MRYSFRQLVGVAVIDLPLFFFRTLFLSGGQRQPPWAWNRNRRDLVSSGPNAEGIYCHWDHTRALHVTNVFPRLSRLLLQRMLTDWPIVLRDVPASEDAQQLDVSFVIGHRGTARLPHLLMTLKSIAGQTGITFECIVVEQSDEQELQELLPSWVRYHFTRTPFADYLYNRSWALNAGARLAKGRIVVLHDGDMLVPTEYAAEMRRQVEAGYDVVNLKRFIAYLDQSSSKYVFEQGRLFGVLQSEEMIANLCAGGSLGITREAYFKIGAMDEDFVGWGGEDTEFWDRCQTLRVANHTYMPIVHLWHPSQPGKTAINGLGTSTANYFRQQMEIPSPQRIALLRSRHIGRVSNQ